MPAAGMICLRFDRSVPPCRLPPTNNSATHSTTHLVVYASTAGVSTWNPCYRFVKRWTGSGRMVAHTETIVRIHSATACSESAVESQTGPVAASAWCAGITVENSASDRPSRIGPGKQASRQAWQVSRFRTGRRPVIPDPFCVRPAPMMHTGAAGEILVCCRDLFAVGPAQRGVALSRAMMSYASEHPPRVGYSAGL